MVRAHTKTTDKREKFDAIKRDMKILDGSSVMVGVTNPNLNHPGKGNSRSNTVAEVAFFNEFGTARIPERSFIRSTMDEKRSEFEATRDRLLNLVVDQRIDVKTALTALGFRVSQEIKAKIVRLNSPPNAPSTIAKKGFNNPLIDTRFMLNSIDFKVDIEGRVG